MSAELKVIDPSVLSEQERADLTANIDALIAAHKNNRQEINRLVFESVSAMTTGEDYERELASKKGLRRFIGGITGSNKKLQDKINSSRAAAQYASQLTLQRLAEQNLMSFDLITAVNNKLNASVLAIEGEINEIYNRLLAFFKQSRSDVIQLENRVERLEQNVNLLNWQNSIEYHMFDGIEYMELDESAKMVCLASDFFGITKGAWNTSDLLLLKTAMNTIGLAPKEKISYSDFIGEIISRPRLKEYFLNGAELVEVPEPYLISLSGMKKYEMLENEEHYIVDTMVETLRGSGLDIPQQTICKNLVQKHIEGVCGIQSDTQIEHFDLLVELLFCLKQAEIDGVFGANEECLKQIEDTLISDDDQITSNPVVGENNAGIPVATIESVSACMDSKEANDDAEESISDSIYWKLQKNKGWSTYKKSCIETDDFFVYERLCNSKIEGLYSINKKTGEEKCLIPRPTDSDLVWCNIDKWISYKNHIYAFFVGKDSDSKLAEVFAIDVESGEIAPINIKVDSWIVHAANEKFFVHADYPIGKLTCVDLESKKKYPLNNKDHCNNDRVCTDDAMFFLNHEASPHQLMMYSFASHTERNVGTISGYGVDAMSRYNDKIFIKTSTFYCYDLSEKNLRKIITDVYDTYVDQERIVKSKGGWLYTQETSEFPIRYFDFKTEKFVTLATGCGYRTWIEGGFFEKGHYSYTVHDLIKIGKWVYYQRGKDGIHTKVSVDAPMEMQVVGEPI